jgi:glutamate synthase domain-containing protein 2
VTSIYLHNKAHEYAALLAKKRKGVVDLAFAGGLAREDQIFKALALGAPHTKLVCMGRAVMIPGFLGSNIEGVLRHERRAAVSGNWDALPTSVSDIGTKEEEIFAGYFEVQKKVGTREMAHIPLGAIAVWTLVDKLRAGLQQLMAGARKFSLAEIARDDLMAGNRETERELGLKFMTDSLDAKAKKLLTR